MEGRLLVSHFVQYCNAHPALTSSIGTDNLLSWFSKVSGVFLFCFFFLLLKKY